MDISIPDADLDAHLNLTAQNREQWYRAAYHAHHIREWGGAAAGHIAAVRSQRETPSAGPSPRVPVPQPGDSVGDQPATGSVWDSLAQCESGGNWASSVGTYEGGIQFLNSTWLAMGGGAYAQHAYDATREQQIAVAERLLAAAGWGQWPVCSRKIGLR